MKYKDLILRKDEIVGGDFERSDFGFKNRSRIKDITIINGRVLIDYSWTATLYDEFGGWKLTELEGKGSDDDLEIGENTEIHEERDSSFTIDTPAYYKDGQPCFLHLIIFPKGKGELNPSEVEGLESRKIFNYDRALADQAYHDLEYDLEDFPIY